MVDVNLKTPVTMFLRPSTQNGNAEAFVVNWVDTGESSYFTDDLEAILTKLSHSVEPISNVVVLLPAHAITLLRQQVDTSQVNYLSEMLPTLLEDQLAQPVEALQFAVMHTYRTGDYLVACMDKAWFSEIRSRVAVFYPDAIYLPEASALPCQPGRLSAFLIDSTLWLRFNDHQIATLSINSPEPSLRLVASALENNVDGIDLYLPPVDQAQADKATSLLESLKGIAPQRHPCPSPFPLSLMARSLEDRILSDEPLPDLLGNQKEQRSALNARSTKVRLFLRFAGLAVAVEMLVTLLICLFLLGSIYYFKSATESEIRRLLPENTPLPDLQALRAEKRPEIHSSSFLPFFQQVTRNLQQASESPLILEQLDYDAEERQLRLSFVIDSMATLRSYEQMLEQNGFQTSATVEKDANGSLIVQLTVAEF